MNNHTHPHAAFNDSEPTTIKSADVESHHNKSNENADKKLASTSSTSIDPLTQHSGIALPMLVNNVDTDQIIPSREMKKVSKIGLSDGLFAGQRYLAREKSITGFQGHYC